MEKRGEPLEMISDPEKDLNLAPQHQLGNHHLFWRASALSLGPGQGLIQ